MIKVIEPLVAFVIYYGPHKSNTIDHVPLNAYNEAHENQNHTCFFIINYENTLPYLIQNMIMKLEFLLNPLLVLQVVKL